MSHEMIRYRKVPKRWKYQLTDSHIHRLHFSLDETFGELVTPFGERSAREPGKTYLVASVPGQLDLYSDGRLVIANGYAWDGPSGPTLNTESSMRGSLVHDALYQLIREGLLPASLKPTCDWELAEICIEDGMWRWRARLWAWMLVQFGWTAL